MSKLEELEEELYGKEEGKASERMGKRIFFPKAPSRTPAAWQEQKKKGVSGGFVFDRRMLRIFFWGLGILGALGIAFFLFLYLGLRHVDPQVG